MVLNGDNMSKPETFNLTFNAKVQTQKRISIEDYTYDIADLKPGDKIKLTLKEVIRK